MAAGRNPETNPRAPLARPYTGTEGPGKSRTSADDARSIPTNGAPARHAVRGDGGKFAPKKRSTR